MSQKSKNSSCIFLTEYYLSSINGISIFSKLFIENYLRKKYDSIIIYELSSGKDYYINIKKNNIYIDYLYVNAHFSKAENYLFKNLNKTSFFKNFILSKNVKKILISHGWTKINFRNHFYYYYYYFKNKLRFRNLERLKFYDKLLFISTINDNFRHLDYKFAIENNFRIEFFDFKNLYIDYIKSIKSADVDVNYQNFLLIISNLEFVKNVFSIFFTKWTKIILSENMINNIIILTPKKNSIKYWIFVFLCFIFKIKIVNDNSKKINLLKSCECLYIPSVTEYLPLVSLEAISFKKKVYSLYKISSLIDYKYYKYYKS